jgi:hypothetical protein
MFNTAVVIDDVVVVDVGNGGDGDAVASRLHRNVGRRLRFVRHRPVRTQDDLKNNNNLFYLFKSKS